MSLDVITIIIDNIEDSGTLFSLLTVSREVFAHASRILYRDPFRSFRSITTEESKLKKKASLIRLLLYLSPATDDNTNIVREAFSLKRKPKQGPQSSPTTMLDYLSFVQHVQLDKVLAQIAEGSMDKALLERYASRHNFRSYLSLFRRALTWSICGHRLGDIRGLEIDPDDISRFTDLASHLYRLRYVFFVMPYNQSYYTFALKLVMALQERHGRDQLLDVRFTGRPVVTRNDDIPRWTMEITQLLPPLFPRGLSLALPLRPMDGYVSRLPELTVSRAPRCGWNGIIQNYSDLSIGQFLQRCRSLTSLDLDFSVVHLQDANMFTWAADEARDRATGRLLLPQVPVARLTLKMRSISATDGRRLLVDAAHGFSRSLQSIYIKFDPPAGGYDGDDLPGLHTDEDERIVMSQLYIIEIRSPDPRVFDGRLLRFCPKLTKLYIFLDERTDSNARLPSWPVIRLPCLTTLSLNGRAVDLFNPASLNYSRKLQIMRLCGTSNSQQTSRDGARRLDHWTWDWNLTQLTELELSELSWAKFSLRILRYCPKLRHLSIKFSSSPNEPPFPLDVSSVLTNPSGDIFPNLKKLLLDGNFSLRTEDFKDLMERVLPGLHALSFGLEHKCTVQRMVEYTKNHAWLREVTFQHAMLSTEDLQKLGLWQLHNEREDIGRCRYYLKKRNTLLMVCTLQPPQTNTMQDK